jgi:hypothetical protein
MRLIRIFFIAAIFACFAHLCSAQFSHISGTSCFEPCTITTTAGTWASVEVGYYGNGEGDPISITTNFSDSCLQINETGWQNNGHYANSLMFYCFNLHGGSTTFTATSESDGTPLYVDDWGGGPTYFMLDNSPPPQQYNGSHSSITLQSLFAPSGNGLEICYGMDAGDGGATITFPSGFSALGAGPILGGLQTFAAEYLLTSSAGSSTPTIGFSSSNLNGAACASFRTTVPTMGILEYSAYTQSNSQTFPMPLPANTFILAKICLPTAMPTDTITNAWDITPAVAESDSTNAYTFFQELQTSAGNPTVSVSSSCGMQLYAFAGVTALGEVSAYFSGSPLFPLFSGVVNLPPGGGILFDFADIVQGNVYTFSNDSNFNFQESNLGGSGNDSTQTFVRVVSSSGQYSNSSSYFGTNPGTHLANNILISLLPTALSYGIPRQHERQSGTGSGDGSFTVSTFAPVKNKALIISAVAANLGPLGSQSDSQGNVWHTLIIDPSGLFGIYFTQTSAAGSYSVTNGNCQCVNVIEVPLPPGITPTADTSTSSYNSSGSASISSGNITTTSTDFLAAIGYINNSGNRLFLNSFSNTWNVLPLACAAHTVGLFMGYQTHVPPSTYGSSWTWGASSVTGAAIGGIKDSNGIVQPINQIIAHNRFQEREHGDFLQGTF